MKSIHLTESQLRYCLNKMNEAFSFDATQETEQTGGNIKQAVANMTSKDPALKSQIDKGEAKAQVDTKALEENCDERNFLPAECYDHSMDDGYEEVMNYLDELMENPRYVNLVYGAMYGNVDELKDLVKMIQTTLGDNFIPSATIRGAIDDFRKNAEKDPDPNRMMSNGGYDSYGMAMESFTKKQIKEARLKNIMSKCDVVRKGDLKK